MNEVRHQWELDGDKWYMKCIVNAKRFETDWNWKESGGICIYCGERASEECRIRKEERTKVNARFKNNMWNGNRRKDRLLGEFVTAGDME